MVRVQKQAPNDPNQLTVWPECATTFNSIVSVDILTLHDAAGQAFEALSILDWGSRYHVVVLKQQRAHRAQVCKALGVMGRRAEARAV